MVAPVTLSGIELFQCLSAPEREAIAARCESVSFSPGDQIISYSEASTDVFFIVSGTVRATIYSSSGKVVTFRDLEAGQMFGELSAIDDQPRSASVVALTDSLLIRMQAEDFWEILKRYPAACTIALKGLTALIRLLCDRVVEFSTLGVKSRIHTELLRLAQKHLAGDNRAVISPIPTHMEIASRVSSHREAVAREMSHLGHIGILERQSAALVVCDVAKLVQLVDLKEN